VSPNSGTTNATSSSALALTVQLLAATTSSSISIASFTTSAEKVPVEHAVLKNCEKGKDCDGKFPSGAPISTEPGTAVIGTTNV
jgi:hypothetical protein